MNLLKEFGIGNRICNARKSVGMRHSAPSNSTGSPADRVSIKRYGAINPSISSSKMQQIENPLEGAFPNYINKSAFACIRNFYDSICLFCLFRNNRKYLTFQNSKNFKEYKNKKLLLKGIQPVKPILNWGIESLLP